MPYSDYFKEPTLNASLDDKIEIIKSNNAKSLELQNKLRNLKSKSITIPSVSDTDKVNFYTPSYSIKERDNDVDNLYNLISLLDYNHLSEEEISNELNKFLKNNKASQEDISKVKLMLYKDYLLYSKMMLEDISSEEFKDLEDTLKSLMFNISLLDDLEEEEDLSSDELNESVNQNNNIFFLLSNTGNVIALENLRKSVPREYYPQFKELLLGLKSGKLKGIKKLSHLGYYELKDFKIRITFDKLSDGNFIVIDAFMKKYDTSGYYRRKLDVRTSHYLSLQNYYLSKINDEKFLSEHSKYFDEVLTLLDSKIDEEDFSYAKKLN